MNIAICDDNVYLGSEIEKLTDKVFEGLSIPHTCEVFSSADNLLAYLQQHPLAFQMYLLDIEMEGTDGLEAAARIRKEDTEAVIIFLTSHAELMPEAFKVLAFQYIVKPLDEKQIISILTSAVHYIQEKRSLYQYVSRKKTYTCYQNQIEYIESVVRKIILHMKDGRTEEYYGTLKEAREKSSGITFAQIHNSYIINMEYVKSVDSHSILMHSGVQLTISKKYHNSFHAVYRKFILMKTNS